MCRGERRPVPKPCYAVDPALQAERPVDPAVRASPEALLDTYHDERHPVGARTLRHTMAQTALQRREDERMHALVDLVTDLAAMEEPRKRLAGMTSGLDIYYPLGEGHPLLGRRMPDLDLLTAEGPLRVFERLGGGPGAAGPPGRQATWQPSAAITSMCAACQQPASASTVPGA